MKSHTHTHTHTHTEKETNRKGMKGTTYTESFRNKESGEFPSLEELYHDIPINLSNSVRVVLTRRHRCTNIHTPDACQGLTISQIRNMHDVARFATDKPREDKPKVCSSILRRVDILLTCSTTNILRQDSAAGYYHASSQTRKSMGLCGNCVGFKICWLDVAGTLFLQSVARVFQSRTPC